MVMLGAYLELTKIVSRICIEAFTKVFGENKAQLIPINKEALRKRSRTAREQVKACINMIN